MQTLVLNADSNPLSTIPLSVISWQEAVKLIYLEKVTVVEIHEKKVSSPTVSMAMPSVVMLKTYFYGAYKAKFTKENLLYRDEFRCQYCSNKFFAKELTMDHVIPKMDGGKRNFENIVMACTPCNLKKGHKYIRPIKEPRRPSYYELMHKRKKFPVYIANLNWKPYLNWPDELVILGKGDYRFKMEF